MSDFNLIPLLTLNNNSQDFDSYSIEECNLNSCLDFFIENSLFSKGSEVESGYWKIERVNNSFLNYSQKTKYTGISASKIENKTYNSTLFNKYLEEPSYSNYLLNLNDSKNLFVGRKILFSNGFPISSTYNKSIILISRPQHKIISGKISRFVNIFINTDDSTTPSTSFNVLLDNSNFEYIYSNTSINVQESISIDEQNQILTYVKNYIYYLRLQNLKLFSFKGRRDIHLSQNQPIANNFNLIHNPHTPSPSPTASATQTPSSTASLSVTPTPTPSPSETPTPTPSPTIPPNPDPNASNDDPYFDPDFTSQSLYYIGSSGNAFELSFKVYDPQQQDITVFTQNLKASIGHPAWFGVTSVPGGFKTSVNHGTYSQITIGGTVPSEFDDYEYKILLGDPNGNSASHNIILRKGVAPE